MGPALREPASGYVWAMVCGFPGDKRRKRLILMLQAYIDESQKDDLPTFKKDSLVLPLQAADLWAAWVRRWADSDIGISEGLNKLGFPWKAQRPDLPRLAFWYDENGIYENLRKIFDAEFVLAAQQARQEALETYRRKYGWLC